MLCSVIRSDLLLPGRIVNLSRNYQLSTHLVLFGLLSQQRGFHTIIKCMTGEIQPIYRVGHEFLMKSKRLSFEKETLKLNPVKSFRMYRQILFRIYHPHHLSMRQPHEI